MINNDSFNGKKSVKNKPGLVTRNNIHLPRDPGADYITPSHLVSISQLGRQTKTPRSGIIRPSSTSSSRRSGPIKLVI